MKMISGLVGFVSMASLVLACSGGDGKVPDPTSGSDPNAPGSGASTLPPKNDGSSSSPNGTKSAPSPASSADGGAKADAAGTPGAGGTPGQPGAPGGTDDNLTCCVDNVSYACPDAKSCTGGIDVDACESGCGADVQCMLDCVKQLGSAGGPTAACAPKGPCN